MLDKVTGLQRLILPELSLLLMYNWHYFFRHASWTSTSHTPNYIQKTNLYKIVRSREKKVDLGSTSEFSNI